jgi:hypothetical protein
MLVKPETVSHVAAVDDDRSSSGRKSCRRVRNEEWAGRNPRGLSTEDSAADTSSIQVLVLRMDEPLQHRSVQASDVFHAKPRRSWIEKWCVSALFPRGVTSPPRFMLVDHSRYAKLNLAQTNRRQSGACRQIRLVGPWLLMPRSFARSKFAQVKVETPDSTRLPLICCDCDCVELGLRGEVIQQPATAKRNAPLHRNCQHVF